MREDTTNAPVPIRVFGGPTALIEYGGLKLLTDPTFDEPGDYQVPSGPPLTKTAPSAITPSELGPLDAVLLSHDQHADNLDHSGRALLTDVPLTLTTPSGAARLGGTARGLAPWEVVGFVLTSNDLPTVYISGDNASLTLVKEIAQRFGPVDTAVLFAGAPRRPVFDGALLVLDSAQAAEATRILGARRVVPVHCDSWDHFTEGRDDVVTAFTAAGLADRLQLD
ncbi:MBL fold metallo-hydrolase [Streptomyces spinoverrucosus]|uniref:MBL fold metallo-hydrolase n=1 Tax=Streptomyces spinoverrucosus TaxID=284043 RepID=UPI001C3F8840|nr:MBL fold metallo-hydrolase [Streptomyces spinoverrucosus]